MREATYAMGMRGSRIMYVFFIRSDYRLTFFQGAEFFQNDEALATFLQEYRRQRFPMRSSSSRLWNDRRPDGSVSLLDRTVKKNPLIHLTSLSTTNIIVTYMLATVHSTTFQAAYPTPSHIISHSSVHKLVTICIYGLPRLLCLRSLVSVSLFQIYNWL